MSYQSSKRRQDQFSSTLRYQSKYDNSSQRQQVPLISTNKFEINSSNMIQQEQIADLQRKIDIILLHNEKLESQKQRYRLIVQEMNYQNTDRAIRSDTARFAAQQTTLIVNKLRKQLQVSNKTYQNRLNQAYQARQILKKQILTLSKLIQQISQQNKSLKLSIKQQSLREQSIGYKLRQQFIRQQAQLQNKLRDQFLIRQIELKNQQQKLKQNHQEEIQQIINKFNNQKQQIQDKHNLFIKKNDQQNRKDKQRIRQKMKDDFQKQKQIIQHIKKQQINQQKQNARQFIKINLQSIEQNDQHINEQYQNQIQALKKSLQSRKRLIQTLLAENKSIYEQKSVKNDSSWFNELIGMKQQLKNVTNSFLYESQLLKLKLAEKHQIDIKQMKKIYQNKIQVISVHIQKLDNQNNRLRDLYQDSLNKKIDLKKQFEIDRSKLKNLVRKLKVQLHGIQQEFRINIDGVRDQNNTFSMTMMKSMIQVKEKANFYAQQNRKLRKAYQEHQQQAIRQKKLCQQKVQFYCQKYQSFKAKTSQSFSEYKAQMQLLELQAQQRENNLRESLNKQHQMIQSLIDGQKKEIQILRHQNQQVTKHSNQIQATIKDKVQQILFYRSKVDQLQADVQRLKMDLQVAGLDDKDKQDTINQWRIHYQTIVSQLQQQKQILNSKIEQKDEHLIQIVKKYKLLEYELQRVVKTLKKRSNLDQKIIELGTDTNLVKNLAQVFSKQTEPLVQSSGNKENAQN